MLKLGGFLDISLVAGKENGQNTGYTWVYQPHTKHHLQCHTDYDLNIITNFFLQKADNGKTVGISEPSLTI